MPVVEVSSSDLLKALRALVIAQELCEDGYAHGPEQRTVAMDKARALISKAQTLAIAEAAR